FLRSWPSAAGVSALVFLPDGSQVAVADQGRAIHLLDAARGGEGVAFKGVEDLLAVTLSADGKQAATAGKDGVVRLWDAATDKPQRQFAAVKGAIRSVTFAPDGKRL